MTLAAEKLVSDIIKLPLPDRANLAHLLIKSLEPNPENNIDKQWEKTISKRSQEIKSGKVICRSSFDVINEIKMKLKNVSAQSS